MAWDDIFDDIIGNNKKEEKVNPVAAAGIDEWDSDCWQLDPEEFWKNDNDEWKNI